MEHNRQLAEQTLSLVASSKGAKCANQLPEPNVPRLKRILFKLSLKSTLCIIVSISFILVLGWSLVQPGGGNHSEVYECSNNFTRSDINSSSIESLSSSTNSPTTSSITSIPTTENNNELDEVFKRKFIAHLTRQAWQRYSEYSWGDDAFLPSVGQPYTHFYSKYSGHTIISAMSSLWVMGLKREFHQAKQWLMNEYRFSELDKDLVVSQVVVEQIGSLLSCFALTGDWDFVEKAMELAEALEPAYENASGLPYRQINPAKHYTSAKTKTTLSNAVGGLLEYTYLLNLISNSTKFNNSKSIISNRIESIQHLLNDISAHPTLFEEVDIETSARQGGHSSLGYKSRQLYSGLVKGFQQSAHSTLAYMELNQRLIGLCDQSELFAIAPTGLWYVREYGRNASQHHGDSMRHEQCYLGATLALTAHALNRTSMSQLGGLESKIKRNYQIRKYRKLATELAETCHQAARRTQSGLPPEIFYFNARDDATNSATDERQVELLQNCTEIHNETEICRYYSKIFDEELVWDYGKQYNLSPELAETYFILWRTTHNQKYRDYAWQLAQSISEHCLIKSGFSSVQNVNDEASALLFQSPQFIGATLKFLYMTFVDDQEYAIDEWIWNDNGQPLPVI